jgi:hypothetical protein
VILNLVLQGYWLFFNSETSVSVKNYVCPVHMEYVCGSQGGVKIHPVPFGPFFGLSHFPPKKVTVDPRKVQFFVTVLLSVTMNQLTLCRAHIFC